MSEPQVTVRLVRAFDGPRHDRLRTIWQTIAEYASPNVVVSWFANMGCRLSHADAFQAIWREECQRDDPPFVLFTEEDFLPELTGGWEKWTGLSFLGRHDAKALFLPYHTRDAARKFLLPHAGLTAGWYALIDKRFAPKNLRFRGRPDPGNQLGAQYFAAGIRAHTLRAYDDCYPKHYGIRYPVGEHLFWSRHLHDDPSKRVSGIVLGEVQQKHDRAVNAWIARQPSDFRRLLIERFPDVARHRDSASRRHGACAPAC